MGTTRRTDILGTTYGPASNFTGRVLGGAPHDAETGMARVIRQPVAETSRPISLSLAAQILTEGSGGDMEVLSA
jgi:hypothetical protein